MPWNNVLWASSSSIVLYIQFIDEYAAEEPPFGFNGLGELVYRRTYSRLKADGVREQWFETVERVSDDDDDDDDDDDVIIHCR